VAAGTAERLEQEDQVGADREVVGGSGRGAARRRAALSSSRLLRVQRLREQVERLDGARLAGQRRAPRPPRRRGASPVVSAIRAIESW
jgi:hypothetical protein